ncbi:MAG: translation initiation factor IF-2 [Candidatus Diapherotrites archaeon]|nr:translation initiation factor IF-2 [Candidatus Diapherotrites archaeon]
MIRKPIITVLGHVDHGKTKILDAIRGTAVAEKEAGQITQHIGATEVPINVIDKISGSLLKKFGFSLSIPGLLFIDTPGHEAFTNLRKRGGSISDLAVLVVDITQGFQPQTLEAIDILRSYKTPFILAANKVDLLHGYQSSGSDFSSNFALQPKSVQDLVDTKVYEIVGKLFERGFQAERFDRCTDFSKQVPIVPLSAKTGEGLPELLMLLSGLSQKFLKDRLEISETEKAKATVLEVKEERGLGKTVDVILYEGSVSVGDEIAVAGRNGIIRARIRALLEPKPLEEIRDPKEKFRSVRQVFAASGVKIAAPGLDDVLAGSPLVVVDGNGNSDDLQLSALSEEVSSLTFSRAGNGVIVKADTLGSLEALIKLLDLKGVPVKKADIGDVSKKDLVECVSALAAAGKDAFECVIFAFHVKVPDDLEFEAQKLGVKIFKSNIIYKLIESHESWLLEERERRKKEKLSSLVFPAKIEVLPNLVFRNCKPAIVGVRVLEGKLCQGVSLLNAGMVVGRVQAIQSEGKTLSEAKKGDEVAVSIDGAFVGKNLNEGDTLLSFIPLRQFAELESLAGVFSDGEKELLEEIKAVVVSMQDSEASA